MPQCVQLVVFSLVVWGFEATVTFAAATSLSNADRDNADAPKLSLSADSSLRAINVANQIQRAFRNNRLAAAGPATASASPAKLKRLGQDNLDPEESKMVAHFHEALTTNPKIEDLWNEGLVPKFPAYHGITYAIGPNPSVETESRPFSTSQGMKEPTEHGESVLLGNRFRNSERPKPSSPHDNVNIVVPGTDPGEPNASSTRVEKCETRNGIRTCQTQEKRQKPRISAQNEAFQGRQTPRPSVSSDLQNFEFLGHVGGLSALPITPPPGGLRASTTRRTTRTTTRSTSTTTARTTTERRRESQDAVSQLQRFQEFSEADLPVRTDSPPEMTALEEHVMSMSPHELRDALMDPMMMMMATVVVMAGAYMAIALQEFNASQAFVAAQLAQGK